MVEIALGDQGFSVGLVGLAGVGCYWLEGGVCALFQLQLKLSEGLGDRQIVIGL